MFEINYSKNNNRKLFEYLEKNGFSDTQNYIPLYSLYFSINDTNYNNINLNNKFAICNILNRNDNNNFEVRCKDKVTNTIHKNNSFFKFSPLLDPVKFMVGKYRHLSNEILCSLPKNKDNICCKKVLDTNNSAYVDSFFSYLSSKLNTEMGFIHGIQFYGSFLAVQNEFKLNIYDDLEYLFDSPFFHENKNNLFDIEDIDEEKMLESDTRNYRKKIKFGDDNEKIIIKSENLDNEIFGGLFEELTVKNLKIHNSDIKEEYSKENITKDKTQSVKKTNSTCSSRSSNTHESEENNSNSEENDEEQSYSGSSLSNSQMSEYSSMDDNEIVNATVFNFPVQIISLEKLHDTLDSLLEDDDNELSDKEWASCLFQIIMILITYQKLFNFTHNDLHTNNIMYCETDKKFINYKYNNVYYRVPTYGKIYKIIDFGRAIYNFKGKTICSDSYHPKGDAATQYNFKPYFNEKKPRLEPNKSFDLCRLGCSLFDYFIEDIEEQKTIKDPIAKLIIEWTKDDKGRNILYKNNGEERYPEFKLYKMIVRTVHNHLPEKQLSNKLFSSFISSKRKIKKQKIINIDKMESMC